MMGFSKSQRMQIWNQYDGRCGYCGRAVEYKKMQVDHIIPRVAKLISSDEMYNLICSCARCNNWKLVFSVDQFRQEIESQPERLIKYHPNYRLALDYGLVQPTGNKVQFYFETRGNHSEVARTIHV